ncbi:MAG: hypothetical protein JSS67_11215 [Bacteroidetes bacterium]|nr:hypothetical protein [Bacteroidota bacterium]
MKIFIIDFSTDQSFKNNFPKDYQIFEEKFDGSNAYKLVGEVLPEKIFINYHIKPSHGRQTAMAIKNRKKTSNIPIYFVDGSEIENTKVQNIGLCIKTKNIDEYI